MASGILCQGCGIEAPTRKVSFRQNIGALVVRFHRKVDGTLCKQCVHRNYWKMTGTTLFLGPWGTISLIVAPFFIINNTVQYLFALGMPAVPIDASVPKLDDADIAKLQPHAKSMVDRLNAKEPMQTVATDIARFAGVTPGQVVLYALALSRSQPPSQKIYGFPVVPLAGGMPPPLSSPPPLLPASPGSATA